MIKKKNLTQSIALSALLSSINAIILFLSTTSGFFLIMDSILILFLPFITTFAFLFIDRKVSFCYVIASITICLLINTEKTCIYLIPSIISGLLFALLIEKKVNIIWITSLTAIINSVVMWGIFLIFDKILGTSIFDGLFIDNDSKSNFIPLLVIISSCIQTVLNTFIIVPEIKKFNIPIILNDNPCKTLLIISIIFSIIGGIILYFNNNLGHFCAGISILFSLPTFYYLYNNRKFTLAGILIGLVIFAFPLLSTLLPNYGFSTFSYISLIIAIVGLFNFKIYHCKNSN